MSTRTRFEKEAKGNSEMAYWNSMSGRISIYEIRDKTRFQTIRLTGNPKIQIWKSMSGRFSASGIRDKILFQIVCSIGNPNIEILRSKSGFTNRTHHYAISDSTSFIAI